MWRRDGNARPRTRSSVGAGPVLGVPALRPAFLDDISPAESRKAQTDRHAFVTIAGNPLKDGLCLTSGTDLPRLAPIFRLSYESESSAGSRPTASTLVRRRP